MIYAYFALTIFALVLFQTSIVPDLWGFDKFFDLIAVLIVYMAIYRSAWECVAFGLFAGAVMDSISGGPFGMYITIYCWLFVGIWLVKNYLHVGNSILIPMITTASVFMENVLIIGVMAMIESNFDLGPEMFRNVLIQLVWAAFAGPLVIFAIRKLQGKVDLRPFDKIFEFTR